MNVIRLKLQNYLSFKDEEINFQDRNGIYLVIGKNDETVDESDGNGSGKTSFISAIRFAIGGRIRGEFSKDLNNEDIIHKNNNDEIEGKCIVEVDCESGENLYRIVRTVSVSGQVLELFVSKDGNEWTCISLKAGISRRTGKRESGITRTQEKINTVLGFDDTLFTNSAYFEQANIDTFARGSIGEKDDIFKSAIGLSKWDDYTSMMKDDLSSLVTFEKQKLAVLEDLGEIKELVGALENAQMVVTEAMENKNNLKKLILKKEAAVSVLAKRCDKIRLECEKRREQLVDSQTKLVEAKTNLIKQQETKKKLADAIKETKILMQNTSENLERQKEIGIGLNNELQSLAKPKKTREEILSYIDQYKATEIELLTKISVCKSQIKNIRDAICPLGLECESCTEESKIPLIDAETVLLEKYTSNLNSIRVKLDYVENMLHTLSSIEGLTRQLDGVREKYNILKASRSSYNDRFKESREWYNDICSDITKTTTIIEQLTQGANEDQLHELVEQKRQYLADKTKNEDELNYMVTLLDDYSDTLQSAQLDAREIENKIVKHKTLTKEFNEIQDRKSVTKKAIWVCSKDIPHILISQAIPEIQYHVRDFTYALSDGRIDMEFRMTRDLKTKVAGATQEINAFDPWVCVDGRWLKYPQTSGGERARIDVAIHLGWVCFMATRSTSRIETLFLDEVGSALDKSGIEKLVSLLHKIQVQYSFKKIFFITQNSDAKKLIDNVIQITKTAHGSKAIFI